MITENNGLFHIQTEVYSYLFQINAYGVPEHIHFGVPVCAEDSQALSVRPDIGRVYGFNLVYSGNHYASAQLSHQGLTRVMQGINPSNLK